MIRILTYDGGDVERVETPDAWRPDGPPGTRFWIDVVAPQAAQQQWLGEVVGLGKKHLAEYGRFPPAPGALTTPGYVYGLLPTPGDGLHFFLATGWLVTLRSAPLSDLDALWEQYASDAERWRYGLDQILALFVEGLVANAGARLRQLQRTPSTDQGAVLIMLSAGQLVTISDLVRARHEALDANVQHGLQLSERRIQTVFSQSQQLVEGAQRAISSRRERFWRLMLGLLLLTLIITITLLVLLLSAG